MVDISSSSSAAKGKGNHAAPSDNSMRTKIILIVTLSVVAVAAIGVTVFALLKNKTEPQTTQPVASKEFTFAEKTLVSGVDITGSTMQEAKALLEKNKDKLAPAISFSVDVGEKSYELTQKDFTYTYNIDDVLKQAKSNAELGVKPTTTTTPSGENAVTYSVTATVTEESVNGNVDKICKDTDVASKNAYVTAFHPYADNRFEFAEATTGYKVNSEDLKSRIMNGFTQGNSMSKIVAEVDTLQPKADIAALKDGLVKLASYETYSYNTENGTSNMQVSLEACNGSIIDPGEEWSFNECTGDSNLESNGYKPASVISEGKITEGIGGGICQSSSTIYNAAVRSDLEIVERYNHKWASAYVPTGLDATIDYPNLDLCLKNKSEFQVFLECRLVDNTLYATFWGVKDGSWDEIHTVNEISDTGSSSYTVRAWRVYVKDGKEVDREELDRSTYDMDSGLIFIEADNDYRADTDGGDGAAADTSSQTGQGAATQTEINNEPEYTPVETEAPVQETPVYEESQSEAYSGTPELPDETIGD